MRDDEKTREDLIAELTALRIKVAELETCARGHPPPCQGGEDLFLVKKYESIGILAEGIAHDFNNLLNHALGSLYLPKKHSIPGSELHERIAEAERSLLTAKDLTYQLLILAKGRESVKRISHIGKLIKNAARLALIGSNIACTFDIDADLASVEVNQGQLNQVVHNLVVNAREAIRGDGTVTVTARNCVYEQDQWPVKAGAYVQVSIGDDGVGIPPDLQARIFDPYFTTKERGGQRGTGLGLAVCYAITKNHRGFITVRSEVGKGSTFQLFLPASNREAATAPEDFEQLLRGRILVMDDEEIDRAVMEDILRRISFDCEFASNGAEALALYEDALRSGRPFDAVIMDLVIPGGMGGGETIERLLEIDPNARAIVTSGYSNDPMLINYRENGFSGSLLKPYRIEELDQVLHRVLFR